MSTEAGQLHFRPTERFADYRDAFDRELALVDSGHLEGHLEEFEAIWADLHRDLALVKPDGKAVAEFLLHVRGEEAWFRYSDEPFS